MYNIVFCCDDNYIVPALVSITSLLETNRDISNKVTFHTFREGLNKENFSRLSNLIVGYGSRLKTISLVSGFKETIRQIPTLDYITETTFYRLLLPYVLTDIDTCLFIDTDTLVKGSLADIWNTDYKEKCISAVLDSGAETFTKDLRINTYCNAGVMLMNLHKIRNMFSYDKFINKVEEVSKSYDLKMADQDLINIIFQNQIALLPDIYNFQDHLCLNIRKKYREHLNEIRIVHFITGKKPWNAEYYYPFFGEYYRYLRKYMAFSKKSKFWIKRITRFFIVGSRALLKKLAR